MKSRLSITVILFLAIFLIPAQLFSQSADVVYVEGWVDLRDSGGDIEEAYIGDIIRPGESILTGADGLAELEPGEGSVITIKPDTVFTYQEKDRDGEKQTVFSTILGAVSFKFSRLLGKEPIIATASTTCGIRGTELTVFAGADGSTLIAVETGLVAVEAEGKMVLLGQNEGVEVRPGEAPGKKFEVIGRELDFSSWNGDKLEAFYTDPIGATGRILRRFGYFHDELEGLGPLYEENRELLSEKRIELNKIGEEKGQEAKEKYYHAELVPQMRLTNAQGLNIRYYALSAMSFKRFVLAPLYIRMKTKYINEPDNPEYKRFLDNYQVIVKQYMENVEDRLVLADL